MDELLLLAGDPIRRGWHGDGVVVAEEEHTIQQALLWLADDDGRSTAAAFHGKGSVLQIELCELIAGVVTLKAFVLQDGSDLGKGDFAIFKACQVHT